MHRRPRSVLAVLLLATPACRSVWESPLENVYELTLRGGTGSLDDDFEPLEDADVRGVELRVGDEGSGLRYLLGASFASEEDGIRTVFTEPGFSTFDQDVEFEATVLEIFAGARYEWNPTTVLLRPYVGAGLSYVESTIDSSPPDGQIDNPPDPPIVPPPSVHDGDNGYGFFVQVGVGVPLGDGFVVELDYRMLFGPDLEDLDGADRDASYDALTIGLTFRF